MYASYLADICPKSYKLFVHVHVKPVVVPEFVRPTTMMYRYCYHVLLSYYTTHKKSLRIQQHPASAFTAAIKNSTRTGQAQASKTSQANTTQHYSTHSSVGTRMYYYHVCLYYYVLL
jgi:hypothetical protein